MLASWPTKTMSGNGRGMVFDEGVTSESAWSRFHCRVDQPRLSLTPKQGGLDAVILKTVTGPHHRRTAQNDPPFLANICLHIFSLLFGPWMTSRGINQLWAKEIDPRSQRLYSGMRIYLLSHVVVPRL